MTEQDTPAGFGSVTGVPELPAGFTDQFTSRWVSVSGLRLHVVLGGTGPALMLIGGWPQFWWQWRHVMPALARHFTVIAVDPRGIGLSDRPPAGYDAHTVAGDLHQLVDQLGFASFHLVGHDLGMWLAYAMAASQPQRISRLVLMEANLPGISDPPTVMPATLHEVQMQWHFMFNRLPEVNEKLVEGREDVYFADQFAVKGATPAAIPAAAVDVYVRALRRPGALHACFRFYREIITTSKQNQAWAKTPLPMPVLAIGGAASRAATVAGDARKIATDVRSLVIPGCGHYIAEEAPDALIQHTLDFFEVPY